MSQGSSHTSSPLNTGRGKVMGMQMGCPGFRRTTQLVCLRRGGRECGGSLIYFSIIPPYQLQNLPLPQADLPIPWNSLVRPLFSAWPLATTKLDIIMLSLFCCSHPLFPCTNACHHVLCNVYCKSESHQVVSQKISLGQV